MLSFSLSSLIVFSEVVKLKSFSKAAETLSMAQPGVSKHIALLESHVGKPLLLRKKGALELTKEGKVVFRHAEKVLAAAKELQDAIRNIQADIKSVLRIGTTRTYARVMMPYILGSFQKAYPQVMIKLDVGGSEEMERTLYAMQNDVVIIANPTPSNKLSIYPFVREELFLIATKHFMISENDSVSLSEIKDYPLIIREEGSATRKIVLSALKEMNVTPAVLIEAKSTEFIIESVLQDQGVAITSKRALSTGEERFLKVIPFNHPLFLDVSVVSLKSKRYDVWIQRFRDFIKELQPDVYFSH